MMSPPKDEHKRKHVTAVRSSLMKTLDQSVESLGRQSDDQGGFVKEIPRDRIYYLVDVCGIIYI